MKYKNKAVKNDLELWIRDTGFLHGCHHGPYPRPCFKAVTKVAGSRRHNRLLRPRQGRSAPIPIKALHFAVFEEDETKKKRYIDGF